MFTTLSGHSNLVLKSKFILFFKGTVLRDFLAETFLNLLRDSRKSKLSAVRERAKIGEQHRVTIILFYGLHFSHLKPKPKECRYEFINIFQIHFFGSKTTIWGKINRRSKISGQTIQFSSFNSCHHEKFPSRLLIIDQQKMFKLK